MRTSVIFVAALMASACGCVFGLGGKKDGAAPDGPGPGSTPTAPATPTAQPATPTTPADDGRIAPDWQDHVHALLKTLPANAEAYALFSEGGWADAGQVIVLVGGGPRRLIVGAPGSRMPTGKAPVYAVDRALSEAEWQSLAPAIAKAATLADAAPPAFDALTFEYVHLLSSRDAPGPVKRLLIRDLGIQKIPEHDAVIAAFQALRKP